MAQSDEDDRRRFQTLGIFDPAVHGEDRLRLLRYLAARGATDDELVQATQRPTLGSLALDRALCPGARLTFAEAAAAAGLSVTEAARLWRALGFAVPASGFPALPEDAARALRFLSTAAGLLGPETSLALTRVLGATTARLAEAVVDAFRVKVEAPLLTQGRSYSEVVENYAGMVTTLFPDFLDALAALLRRQMVTVASRTWSLDEEGATLERELVVGFVDLVGYTAAAASLSSRQLADLVGRFETLVDDVVSRHAGRVVKLLGDGAMFLSENASNACRIAVELLQALVEDAQLPPARVGLAAGRVVALHGDYQGPVVNIAARLLGAAPPSSILVDEAVRRAAGAAFRFEAHNPAPLKGLPTPPPTYLLRS